MRIIQGLYKGRTLLAPKGRFTRPTSDKVRQALFSILGVEIESASFLDGFAGTGAIGLEAESRGASKVFLVEKNATTYTVLKTNVANLGAEARHIQGDFFLLARQFGRDQARFDLIWIDPPYQSGLHIKSLEAIVRYGILADKGLIITESDKRTELPENFDGLVRTDQRKYGETVLTFYNHAETMEI